MEPSSVSLLQQDAQLVVSTYAKADLEIVQGNGSWVTTAQGERYLDFVSGIAVNAFGHGHPHIKAAIHSQLESFSHLSNLYPNSPQLQLAQRMLAATGMAEQDGKAFFCNSGTEANEAAIKFARKYFDRLAAPRTQIITFLNSFHGRTYGALAATGQDSLKQGFGAMPSDFVHIPWNDVQALQDTVTNHTCAIMLEPIAAEGGILNPSAEFVAAINALRNSSCCLVIADEIQTGLGRCGALQGAKLFGIDHDVSTWAKALGGGLPLGMVLLSSTVAAQMKPGDHGTTFGGNPISCAAGLAVLELVTAPGFMDQVQARSLQLQEGLRNLAKQYSWLGELRGSGLLMGIVTDKPVADLVVACRNQKLLVHRAGANILRLLPPLNVSASEITDALQRLNVACASLN